MRKQMMAVVLAIAGVATSVQAGEAAVGSKLASATLGVLVGITFSIGMLALLFLFGVLRPQTVRRGSERVRTAPGRCLWTGLLALLVLVGGVMLLGVLPKPLAALPFVLLVLVVLYLVISALSIVAHGIGERVQTALAARSLGADAVAVVYGAVPLLAVGLLVGLGQLIQLVAFLIGLGAAIGALFERREKSAAPAANVPPVVAP
jgi:hypothetical protein